MTATVPEWNTTAASNTAVAGIDIAENCAAANVNNAIRAVMASTKGALLAVATSGTDTYTATLAPAPVAYTSGMAVFLRFGNANTSTTPTINLNSLGAKTIVESDGATALLAGALNGDHLLVYDGTNFRVLNPVNQAVTRHTTVEIGHASDTTLSRSAAGRLAVEGKNSLLNGQTDTLTAGYSGTPYNAGTKSSGTFTPDEANGNLQYAVNGGAHTLAPPTNNCTIIVQYTNNGSAGAVTTSGFSKVSGSFTTTNGDDFFCYITKNNGFSHLNIVALQ